MELLRGDTLADRIRTGTMPTRDALSMVRQMAAAIDAAHLAHVAHGDFKPANVMIVASDAGDRLVVTDFGLARWLPLGSALLTIPDSRQWGTPAYMAPRAVLRWKGHPRDRHLCVGSRALRNRDRTPAVRVRAWRSRIPPGACASKVAPCPSLAARVREGSGSALGDRHTAMPRRESREAVRARQRHRQGARAAAPATRGGGWPALRLLPAPLLSASRQSRSAVVEMSSPISTAIARYFGSERTIAILPFSHENRTAEGDAVSIGLSAAVTDRLATLSDGWRGLHVVPVEQVIDTGVDTLERLQQTLGATLVVTGRLAAGDGHTQVTVALNEMSREAFAVTGIEASRSDPGIASFWKTRSRRRQRTVEGQAAVCGHAGRERWAESLPRRTVLSPGTRIPVTRRGPSSVGHNGVPAGDARERWLCRCLRRSERGVPGPLQRDERCRVPPPRREHDRPGDCARTRQPACARHQGTRLSHHRATQEGDRRIPEGARHRSEHAVRTEPAGRRLRSRGRDGDGGRGIPGRHRSSPRSWSGYEDLGTFLYRQGRYDEAEQNYVSGIGYAPANKRAIANLAAVYEIQERFLAAEGELIKGLKVSPNAVLFQRPRLRSTSSRGSSTTL